MENLATHEYHTEISKKVREELKIANIPVYKLPYYMNNEVKTEYIGILNGFSFYRAWTYWVCEGDMPLSVAKQIYEKFGDMGVRANGYAGGIDPETVSYNPEYEKAISECVKKYKDIEKAIEESRKIRDDKTLPRFVSTYHIDTQLGLCSLAKVIREQNIHSELKMLEQE